MQREPARVVLQTQSPRNTRASLIRRIFIIALRGTHVQIARLAQFASPELGRKSRRDAPIPKIIRALARFSRSSSSALISSAITRGKCSVRQNYLCRSRPRCSPASTTLTFCANFQPRASATLPRCATNATLRSSSLINVRKCGGYELSDTYNF